MGTPEFAVSSLDAIFHSEHEVVGVVTVPDKPAGRGQKLQQSAVKQYAVEKNIPVLQPEKLRSEDFLLDLHALNADLFVVVAFRMLPEVVWQMPPKGTFNLHGSLLPRYRGAAPINWAVINGDSKTGVTTFFLKHEIDTGNIIYQEEVAITAEDNAGSIHDKLMVVGAKLVVKTLDAISQGAVPIVSQEELIAKGYEPLHAPKIFKEDCKVDWSKDVTSIHNLVRGLSPYPAAWSELVKSDELLSMKIFKTEKEVTEHDYTVGTLLTDARSFLKVACVDGFLSILELQLAGKKRMPIRDFLLGFKNIADYMVK
jgi:methionyl-tRNA formyltransferase